MNNIKDKKVLGLILELNPFHKGHKYFIDKVKEEIKPDLTISIISSSFTMRGEISVIDKFTKANLALNNGIDMVIELPFVYSNNSADYFAYYSVKLLNEFNITHLAFGSELGDINKLNNIINITKQIKYNEDLKSFIDKGNSYQSSALKAFMANTNDNELITNFSLPNNSLALSYIKSINEINNNIIPYTIKRIDNEYYSNEVEIDKLASASALRNLIDNNEDISSFIPYSDYDFVNSKIANEKLYSLLKYNLIQNRFNNILSISEGIENRMISFINDKTYEEFIEDTQTRRYSKNRISRTILNIITQTDKRYENKKDVPLYLRILAINANALRYLKDYKDKFIINNTKDALDSSNDEIKYILLHELEVTKIYDLVTGKDIYKQEFILNVRK